MIPSNKSGWSAAAARWNSATSFWRSLMKAAPSPPKNANGSRSFRAAPPSSSIISRISPPLTAEEKAAIAAVAPVSVSISAAAGTGLAELTEAVRQVVGLSHFDPTAAIIANARQLECITAARRSLGEGIEALAAGETLDAVSVCLEQAADALLTLTGRRASAEAIDKVFEQFCVGK
ncbi:MAG: hypothetical protein ACLUNX_07280 [Angelakisella sp.]